MRGVSLIIFAVATGAVIMVASLYGVWLMQTNIELNNTAIQLEIQKSYIEAFMLSAEYSCSTSIDNYLLSHYYFQAYEPIAELLKDACARGINSMNFSAAIQVLLSYLSVNIYSSGRGDAAISIDALVFARNSISEYRVYKELYFTCPLSILDAQKALLSIEKSFIDNYGIRSNSSFMYQGYLVDTYYHMSNITDHYSIAIYGEQHLCNPSLSESFAIFTSGIIYGQTNLSYYEQSDSSYTTHPPMTYQRIFLL